MKVRVMYTEEFSDEDRRALWWGGNGGEGNPHTCPMEKRADIQAYLEDMGLCGLCEVRIHYGISCDAFDDDEEVE